MSNTNEEMMMYISETHQRSNITRLSLLTWWPWQTLHQRIGLASKLSKGDLKLSKDVKLQQVYSSELYWSIVV